MDFTRLQGGSGDGLDTHKTTYFRRIYNEIEKRYPFQIHELNSVDPFARNCNMCDFRNDIDPETNATHHLDALDFLIQMYDEGVRAGLVIFDPPFSPRQAERYEAGHVNVYTDPGYVPKLMREIERLLVAGGLMLKFGYNSTRHRPTFRLLEGWVVNFGAMRNDVVVTLWMKEHTLEDFV